MKKIFTSIILISFLITTLIVSNIYAAGVTSAEFLLIGVGARAQGLGGAYTAMSDDVNSIYWNQAGLALLKKPEMSFMHNMSFENISYNYMGVGVPTRIGTFGLSAHYLNMGDIVGRETQISESYLFSANDAMVTFGYGAGVVKNGFAGLNVKYLRETIDDVTAEGFAFDFGLLYLLDKYPINFGLAAHNIGGKLKYVQESENLPLDVTYGLAYRFGGFCVGLDVKHYIFDKNVDLHVGTEFTPHNIVVLRGGMLYNMMHNTNLIDGSENKNIINPSGGIGLKIGSSLFDYAITPFNNLGSTHKISLTVQF